MTSDREAAVYDASKRIHAALDLLRQLRRCLDGTLPVPAAETALGCIDDDIADIERNLGSALELLDAEIERIEDRDERRRLDDEP